MKVVKMESSKILEARIIYLILDSKWVSLIQVVPKKNGMVIVANQNNKLIPTRI